MNAVSLYTLSGNPRADSVGIVECGRSPFHQTVRILKHDYSNSEVSTG
jgi:hypothetical protein